MSETVPLWFKEIRFHLAEHVGPGGWVETEPTGAATISSRVDPGVMVGDRIPIGIISGRSSKTTARVADVRPPGDNKSGRYEVDVDDIITEEVSMSQRPTPQQIAASQLSIHRRGNPSMAGPNTRDVQQAETLIAHLGHYGYVIVHPADVPERELEGDISFVDGWNACRDRIFGGRP